MLTDEQLEVLKPGDRGIPGFANEYIDDEYVGGWCRHVVYFAGELATALLARQRLERRLGRLKPYAVHQFNCGAVLGMTNHCSCGLHAALRNEGVKDAGR